MKELTKAEQKQVEELGKFKEILMDYMLTLSKVMTTHADYEAYKPVCKQIYVLEDMVDAMRDAIYSEESQK